MSRDYRKLEVFIEADALVPELYRVTADLPPGERYGLQAQLRKAAVSVPANLVEGSSRRSTIDYCRFVEVAFGSAREVFYLLGLTNRLGLLSPSRTGGLIARYDGLQARLNRLVNVLAAEAAREKRESMRMRRTSRSKASERAERRAGTDLFR